MLYESMRDNRTVIASGGHCCRTEEREQNKRREKEIGKEHY